MNIFEKYLENITNAINALSTDHKIQLSEDGSAQAQSSKLINRINIDTVPEELGFDISTNVAMVLAKPNKKNPIELANFLYHI